MAIIHGTILSEHLDGTAFNDAIYGDGGHDLIDGGAGDDLLFGDAGDDWLLGGDGRDWLIGGDGRDTLRGGSGNDALMGGGGDNNYWGDSGYDTFVMSDRSSIAESYDWVRDFTFDVDRVDVSAWGISDFSQIAALIQNSHGAAFLPANFGGEFHSLYLDGISADDLLPSDFVYSDAGPTTQTGTSSDDMLFGSRNGDALYGLGGNDTLLGGMGDDLLVGGGGLFDNFIGGSGRDEASFTGTNTAINVALALGGAFVSIEDVTGGNGNDLITGDAVGNVLDGNKGNDRLDGGRGADTLVGSYGRDAFCFRSSLGSGNVDAIADFSSPQDTIELDAAIFAGLPIGVLSASRYAEGNFSSAQDASDRIIYNNTTGGLFFDRDGIGGVAAVRFATFDPGLAASLGNLDFLVN